MARPSEARPAPGGEQLHAYLVTDGALQRPPLDALLCDLAKLRLRHGHVRLVLEANDRLALEGVARDAAESRDGARLRRRHAVGMPLQRGHVLGHAHEDGVISGHLERAAARSHRAPRSTRPTRRAPVDAPGASLARRCASTAGRLRPTPRPTQPCRALPRLHTAASPLPTPPPSPLARQRDARAAPLWRRARSGAAETHGEPAD